MAIRLVSKAELIRLNRAARGLSLPNLLDDVLLEHLSEYECYQVTDPLPLGEHLQVKVRLNLLGSQGLLAITREDYEALPLMR